MSENWFTGTIQDWDASIPWQELLLERAASVLWEISRKSGGELVFDQTENPAVAESHAKKVADQAIQSFLTRLARTSRLRRRQEFYAIDANLPVFELTFLQSSVYVPKVELNSATASTLNQLPGIGPITSRKILEYRSEIGGFKSIADLERVPDLSRETIDKFRFAVYVLAARERYEFHSPAVVEFLAEPTMPRFVKLLTQGVMLVRRDGSHLVSGDSVSLQIIDLLQQILDEIEISKSTKRKSLGQLSSRITDSLREESSVEAEIAARTIQNSACAVIGTGEYLRFVEGLLSEAKVNIFIAMFYVNFENSETYPTAKLLNTLVDKKEEGLDVKVVLDQDRDIDPYESRIINKPAYEFLKANGVSVVYDTSQRTLHAKMVIIDGNHILLGSHNWTAGSFFQYDDKSLYVQSHEFNQICTRWFSELWNESTSVT